MDKIYNYLNYRKYLMDFYNEQKALNSSFSYKYFANKAGFKSKSYLAHIIDGKRNLSKDSLFKLKKVLKLSDKSFSYFSDLVSFNHAEDPIEQDFYFKKLMQYNKKSKSKKILQQQYDYFSQWYHQTIRELVTIVNFRENYSILANMLQPNITAREARASVRLLLELGLIKKARGGYKQTEAAITTGDEVSSVVIRNFHRHNLELASDSIDLIEKDKRDISCIIGGLSHEGLKTVKEEIQQFRKKLINIIDNDKAPKLVCHINFQLFPTTCDPDKED